MIADGHHLPGDTLKAMVRAKGVERSILISDAVALAGMPAGTYDAPVGGRVELQSNGRLNVAGTECLAGAAVPLKDGIARAMTMTGISLGDSVRMATENPGRFVGGIGTVSYTHLLQLFAAYSMEGAAPAKNNTAAWSGSGSDLGGNNLKQPHRVPRP